MGLYRTKNNRIVLRKASSLIVVPWVYNDTVGDYVIGGNYYDIYSIIGDSIALTQEKDSEDNIYNEFSNVPIVSNTVAGAYKFTAQCLDVQNTVLATLFGARGGQNPSTGNTEQGMVVMPSDYEELYVMVKIDFHDTNMPSVIIPKLHLNSSLYLQQLQSRGAQCNLAGIVKNARIAVLDRSVSPQNSTYPMYGFRNTSGVEYTPMVTVMFLPQRSGFSLAVYHSTDAATQDYVFSRMDFRSGVTSNDIYITQGASHWSFGAAV